VENSIEESIRYQKTTANSPEYKGNDFIMKLFFDKTVNSDMVDYMKNGVVDESSLVPLGFDYKLSDDKR
jgi:hypothetical protein